MFNRSRHKRCSAHGNRQREQKEVVMALLNRLLRDERGATAIEYGLIAAGIAVAIVAVVQGIGTNLNSTFTKVKNNLS